MLLLPFLSAGKNNLIVSLLYKNIFLIILKHEEKGHQNIVG